MGEAHWINLQVPNKMLIKMFIKVLSVVKKKTISYETFFGQLGKTKNGLNIP